MDTTCSTPNRISPVESIISNAALSYQILSATHTFPFTSMFGGYYQTCPDAQYTYT